MRRRNSGGARVRGVLGVRGVRGARKVLAVLGCGVQAQSAAPDWRAVEEETLRHYQALLRFDTRNPPGNETVAAEYIKDVLDREGIPAQLFASDPKRANVVARLKGSGKKR